MSTETTYTASMKDAMMKALLESSQSPPSTLSELFTLLHEAQDALHESGYTDTIFGVRQGLKSDYGLRYTAYLSNTEGSFENPMFSIFVADDQCAFQAEGQIQSGLTAARVIGEARTYLLKPHVVELMTGLLRQFGRVK